MPLEGFRNNRNFVIEAVQENAEALRYAADGFLNDRDLVKDVAKAKAEALRYASAGFRSDRKFVIEAVQENAEYEASSSSPLGTLTRVWRMRACSVSFSSSPSARCRPRGWRT